MNNTLANGLRLLLHLASTAEAFAVSALARQLEWPKSHVYRLLRTLLECGYVEQDADRRYQISPGALRLSRALLINLPIRLAAVPVMEQLTMETTHVLTLAMPFGAEAISIACMTPLGRHPDPLDALGSVLSPHASACGKLFLAFKPPEEREALLQELDYTVFTPQTHRNAKSLLKDLLAIERLGISVSRREYGTESVSMAVPVRNGDGRLIAALAVTEKAEKFTTEKQHTARETLFAAAGRIEKQFKEKQEETS